MYVNIVFSLPKEAELELRAPSSLFTYGDNRLKRIISVMHTPGDANSRRIAVNLVSFTLGSPLRVLRSIMGARFVQGEVNDTDRLSQCSFSIDVPAHVESSLRRHEEVQEDLLKAKTKYSNMAQRNLCQEIMISPSFYSSSFESQDGSETVAEAQFRRDAAARQPGRLGRSWMDRGAHLSPLDVWAETNPGGDFDGDMVNRMYYAEVVSRELRTADIRDGFNRQLLTHTRGFQLIREGGERARRETMRLNSLLALVNDYTATTPDLRPHLPHNQRNRGPVPRNQRW